MSGPTSHHDREYVRFSPGRRVEHWVTMVTFTLLVLTGVPQKFSEADWARGLTWLFGGLHTMRWIHRINGFVMAAAFILHFALGILFVIQGKKESLSIVPGKKDFTDAVQTLRYYLGLSDTQARFDRYDYRQKFEYWGLILGSIIMTATGLILFFPVQVANLLPGEAIPAAKLAHGNEGLLAFLTILIWHIYNAHLNPDVFPFDKTIFTGKISRHRMEHEHPAELDRWDREEGAAPGASAGAQHKAG